MSVYITILLMYNDIIKVIDIKEIKEDIFILKIFL